jgi:DNA-binding transcriptional ArsR family regulator
MVTAATLDRTAAAQYASWFRALSDPTRVQMIHLLARSGAPMTIGEVTEALGIGQSTASHHVKALARVGFVTVHKDGTTSRVAVNEACVECFPSAADLVMGIAAPRLQPASLPGRGR